MVGLMGSGKTAIGGIIAQMIGVPFLDSDEEIERAANMTIAEIFERDGEGFFRVKETQVIERLLTEAPCILSTGGGAFVSGVNQKKIMDHGTAVWLKADLDLLWSRVKAKNTRPLLRVPDPQAKLASLAADREPAYAKAQIIVEASGDLSKEDMAERVLKALLADKNSGLKETPDA